MLFSGPVGASLCTRCPQRNKGSWPRREDERFHRRRAACQWLAVGIPQLSRSAVRCALGSERNAEAPAFLANSAASYPPPAPRRELAPQALEPMSYQRLQSGFLFLFPVRPICSRRAKCVLFVFLVDE